MLHTGKSEFQDVGLLETGPFGTVLLLDGKLQSAGSSLPARVLTNFDSYPKMAN